MDQAPQTPVPAPTSTVPPLPAPTTVSATVDAATKGDFSAFQDASIAARRGTPKPAIEVPAVAPTIPTAEPAAPAATAEPSASTAPPPPALSKRQQDANERTRLAVERATADLQRELAELRARVEQAPSPHSAPVTAPTQAEWKRFAEMPDAPKLDAVDAQGNPLFTSIEEHTAAMSYFIAKQLHQETQEAAQRHEFNVQRQRFLQARGEKFQTALHAAVDADPDFLDKIPPAVATARPLSGCIHDQRGMLIDPNTHQPATFANVVAEAGFRSDTPDRLFTYLHTHQDEAVAIASLPPSEWLPSLIHLDGRLSGPLTSSAAPAASAPAASASSSPISAAPPPPPTIARAGSTTDPKLAALERNDFPTFQSLERAERAAKRRPA